MKIAVRIIQVLVGILFIVSGLVKANDPLGLAYKMQEYFELWTSEVGNAGWLISIFDFFHNNSLFFSIFMITLEIIAGVALLIGWMKRTVLYLLLALIIFFTFLTGYAYLSGKFTNCGCFGDCIPITPLTSFTKDIVLLVLIGFLIIGQRYIQPLFSNKVRVTILIASLLLTLALQWYVLAYLPLVDCLPFKKGNNIEAQMKAPPGSVPDSIAIRFIYEKGGKQYEFAPDNLPADFETYTYVDRIDKVVRKGNAVPPIKGFVLKGVSDTDSASAVLQMPKAILIFMLEADEGDWMKSTKEVITINDRVPVYVITSASLPETKNVLAKNGLGQIPVFTCDNTAVKTAARTDPTIYYIERGTVINKWSGKEIAEAVRFITKN
jgi:uncharacterized membrane protein YphA (DoxX/SURF4 family)